MASQAQLDAHSGLRPARRPGAISAWLLLIALLVFGMVVIGGITRLTESGLSMVRWEPVSGAIPPMNEMEWQAEFDAYRSSPEYQKINQGMSLTQFKSIFFWEYVHRLLGRFIGLAFALPLLWFAWKRAIPRGYGWRLAGLLFLGGLQGVIGWWMVASGLVDRPEVSHIRLAVHLLLPPCSSFGLLIWSLSIFEASMSTVALGRAGHASQRRMGRSRCSGLQLMFGAYVAGSMQAMPSSAGDSG
jgi:cytochrome c oxidase assembly protein subunit 15